MRAVRIYDRVGRRYEPRGQVLESGEPDGPEAFVAAMREWLATGVLDRNGAVHQQGPGLLAAFRDKYTTGFTAAVVVEDHEGTWGPAPDPWEQVERQLVRVFRLNEDRSAFVIAGEVLPEGRFTGDAAFTALAAGLWDRGGFYHPDDQRRYREGPRLLEAALATFSKLLDHYALIEERDAAPSTPYPSPWRDWPAP